MGRLLTFKTAIVNLLFSDVLQEHTFNTNRNNLLQARYLYYNQSPDAGINELYNILTVRAIDNLEEQLQNGITSPAALFTPLTTNYGNLIQDYYNSLKFELAVSFYDKATNFENTSGTLLDKSQLFFMLALLSILNNDTIGASTYWELTLSESQRVNGVNHSLNYIFNRMGHSFTTLLNPIKADYVNNPIISKCLPHYSTYIFDYQNTLMNLQGLQLLSYVSCGIRLVQVTQMFDKHFNSVQIIKTCGQELITALCILCESLLKSNTTIQTLIPNAKDRMIGNMIDQIMNINLDVGGIFGISSGVRTGLYSDSTYTYKPLSQFDTNFPNWIQSIESLTLSPDAFRANVLFCLHQLRNNAMHDLNTNIIYYQTNDLFQKTIGVLFMCVNIIMTL